MTTRYYLSNFYTRLYRSLLCLFTSSIFKFLVYFS
nr:MAG TPA: hypothetical protein [Caudoviricetes sp.]